MLVLVRYPQNMLSTTTVTSKETKMKSHLVGDNDPPAIVGELLVVGLRGIATAGAR